MRLDDFRRLDDKFESRELELDNDNKLLLSLDVHEMKNNIDSIVEEFKTYLEDRLDEILDYIDEWDEYKE